MGLPSLREARVSHQALGNTEAGAPQAVPAFNSESVIAHRRAGVDPPKIPPGSSAINMGRDKSMIRMEKWVKIRAADRTRANYNSTPAAQLGASTHR